MIMITTILWDVDRTLLDFDAAESAAIRSLFAEFSFGECPEDKVHRYSAINERYWQRMEHGEIDKNEVLVGRFREFFETEGLDASLAAAFNEKYQLRLGDTIVFRDDSFHIVESLCGKVRQVCRIQRHGRRADEEAAPVRPRRTDGRRVPLRAARRGKTEPRLLRSGLRRHPAREQGAGHDRRRFTHERYARRKQCGHRDLLV